MNYAGFLERFCYLLSNGQLHSLYGAFGNTSNKLIAVRYGQKHFGIHCALGHFSQSFRRKCCVSRLSYCLLLHKSITRQ
jgi:hypothetical protein